MKNAISVLLVLVVFFNGCKKAETTLTGKTYSIEEIELRNKTNEEKRRSLNVYYDLDDICLGSECKKPILLFFTGYSCVNAIKMTDDLILGDVEIYNSLSENFINVWLYVDDKKVGKKWLGYEVENFKKNTQPLFVVLNSKKEPITKIMEYTNDSKKFLKFLNEGKDSWLD